LVYTGMGASAFANGGPPASIVDPENWTTG
jgi:hypothetical protein